jgi:hypothetical protein
MCPILVYVSVLVKRCWKKAQQLLQNTSSACRIEGVPSHTNICSCLLGLFSLLYVESFLFRV